MEMLRCQGSTALMVQSEQPDTVFPECTPNGPWTTGSGCHTSIGECSTASAEALTPTATGVHAANSE